MNTNLWLRIKNSPISFSFFTSSPNGSTPFSNKELRREDGELHFFRSIIHKGNKHLLLGVFGTQGYRQTILEHIL